MVFVVFFWCTCMLTTYQLVLNYYFFLLLVTVTNWYLLLTPKLTLLKKIWTEATCNSWVWTVQFYWVPCTWLVHPTIPLNGHRTLVDVNWRHIHLKNSSIMDVLSNFFNTKNKFIGFKRFAVEVKDLNHSKPPVHFQQIHPIFQFNGQISRSRFVAFKSD